MSVRTACSASARVGRSGALLLATLSGATARPGPSPSALRSVFIVLLAACLLSDLPPLDERGVNWFPARGGLSGLGTFPRLPHLSSTQGRARGTRGRRRSQWHQSTGRRAAQIL